VSQVRDNLSLYLRELPSLLPEFIGRWALVCDGELTIFADEATARLAGRAYCADPLNYLVIKIEPLE
jgi:hypothetical protein